MKEKHVEPSAELATSVPDILEDLIQQAEHACASDIHLQMQNGGADFAFRLDGLMTPVAKLSGDVAERVFGRIKLLARLKAYQDSMPQDGRIEHGPEHERVFGL